MELRESAADAFAKSRERYGVLLSTQEIALQYDRYNTSETASAEVQQLLGRVLDTTAVRLTEIAGGHEMQRLICT